MIEKLVGIVKQQVEYQQLFDRIKIYDNLVNITVYEQKVESTISLLDFESCEKLWNQGIDFSNVNIYTI
jgi:hypothetical protein